MIEQNPYKAVLDGLPKHLGEWLDRSNSTLVYDVCFSLRPTNINKGRVFTAKKLEHEICLSFNLKGTANRLVAKQAVVSVLSTLANRDILAHPKGALREWPFGRNAAFVIAEGEETKAKFYETLASFGQRAGIPEKETSRHLQSARIARERIVPLDDYGL